MTLCIKTNSQIDIQSNRHALYQEFCELQQFHKFVGYYQKNSILLRGDNWLIKEIEINAGLKPYHAISIITFKPKLLKYDGVQLEGFFKHLSWKLQIRKIGKSQNHSRVLSSHRLIATTDQMKSWGSEINIYQNLKNIEEELLRAMKEKIEKHA